MQSNALKLKQSNFEYLITLSMHYFISNTFVWTRPTVYSATCLVRHCTEKPICHYINVNVTKTTPKWTYHVHKWTCPGQINLSRPVTLASVVKATLKWTMFTSYPFKFQEKVHTSNDTEPKTIVFWDLCSDIPDERPPPPNPQKPKTPSIMRMWTCLQWNTGAVSHDKMNTTGEHPESEHINYHTHTRSSGSQVKHHWETNIQCVNIEPNTWKISQDNMNTTGEHPRCEHVCWGAQPKIIKIASKSPNALIES